VADALPRAVTRLIEELSRLPTVGPKTAQRLAFFLLRGTSGQAQTLGTASAWLHEGIQTFGRGRNFADLDPCAIG